MLHSAHSFVGVLDDQARDDAGTAQPTIVIIYVLLEVASKS
jgi:hypothetical protein